MLELCTCMYLQGKEGCADDLAGQENLVFKLLACKNYSD